MWIIECLAKFWKVLTIIKVGYQNFLSAHYCFIVDTRDKSSTLLDSKTIKFPQKV